MSQELRKAEWSGRQVLQDEALVLGGEICPYAHLTQNGLGFAGGEIFGRNVAAATLRLEKSFAFRTLRTSGLRGGRLWLAGLTLRRGIPSGDANSGHEHKDK